MFTATKKYKNIIIIIIVILLIIVSSLCLLKSEQEITVYDSTSLTPKVGEILKKAASSATKNGQLSGVKSGNKRFSQIYEKIAGKNFPISSKNPHMQASVNVKAVQASDIVKKTDAIRTDKINKKSQDKLTKKLVFSPEIKFSQSTRDKILS